MRPNVDEDLCIGCGLCADIAPDVFELGDSGLSEVIGDVDDANRAAAEEAAESCPTSSIDLSL